MSKVIIAIHGLSKKYRDADFFSVQNLSLQVHKGEIFGLLGPNGAGKTTLISMLCGLVKPTQGNFSITGLSYKNDSLKIKNLIGVVPQEYALYPSLTARENLMFFGAMYGIKSTDLKQKVTDSLEQLGLTKFSDKKISAYSGGMKRRVNLIAGLLHNPQVLFLDEPTVGVDVQSRGVIIDYLKQVNTTGTTIIYTSHHLTEAQDLCHRIAIIDNGTVLATNTPAKLIQDTTDAGNLEDVFLSLTGKALRDA